MEVREIYKISDMIHKAAGWKKENVFLFLNTIFWAVLAFVIGVAAFTLITGTIAGHGVSLFCITGYDGLDPEIFRDMENAQQKNLSANVTYLSLPQSRNFTFNLNVTF